MAYRRSKGKAKKIQPASTMLRFRASVLTPGSGPGVVGTTDTYYIDLPQCMSIINRRFYRQGIQVMVKSIKVLTRTLIAAGTAQTDDPPIGRVRISTLPKTWVMSNAWEKGFRTWQKMNKEALEEAPSTKPKFLDFKIFADADHHEAGFDSNLIPIDSVGDEFVVGEWESSKFIIPKTDGSDGVHNREVVAVGANYPGTGASGLGAVSLIEGYAASRGLPEILDPNVPTDMDSADGDTPANWMSALFNDGTTQDARVLADMQTENNQAPYPFENGLIPNGGGATWADTYYPGGINQAPTLEVVDEELITATTIGGTTVLSGGIFPCGLMRVDLTNNTKLSEAELMEFTLMVELMPGSHRGYLCEPMTEM